MRQPIRPLTAIIAGNFLLSLLPMVAAADDTKEKTSKKKKDRPIGRRQREGQGESLQARPMMSRRSTCSSQ